MCRFRAGVACTSQARRRIRCEHRGIVLRPGPCSLGSRLSFDDSLSPMSESTVPTLDLGVLVRDCVARVRPTLPASCACKTGVQSGSLVHVDLSVLVRLISLLLQAASLRLSAVLDPNACPRLSLRVKGGSAETVVRLRYNAPAAGSREANAHQALALKVFESLGGAASVRSTRRWSILHVRLTKRPDTDFAAASRAARLLLEGAQ